MLQSTNFGIMRFCNISEPYQHKLAVYNIIEYRLISRENKTSTELNIIRPEAINNRYHVVIIDTILLEKLIIKQ